MGLRAWWKRAPFGVRREAWVVLRCIWTVATKGNGARTGKGRVVVWREQHPSWAYLSPGRRNNGRWQTNPYLSKNWWLEETKWAFFEGVRWHTPFGSWVIGYDHDA